MRLQTALLAALGLAVLSPPAVAEKAWTDAKVNMRAGPGTSHSVVKVLPYDTEIDVESCSGGWCRVRYGSRYGYISEDYIMTESDWEAYCWFVDYEDPDCW